MEELVLSMRKCLANTFVAYFKAHAFHWNVEGIHFPTYHGFFSDIYEDLHSAVDPIAEEIRALGAYAPTGLNEMYGDSTIADSNLKGDSVKEMLSALLMDNAIILECLNNSFKLANDADEQGLADFLAGRIDIHNKRAWMLRASLKGAY